MGRGLPSPFGQNDWVSGFMGWGNRGVSKQRHGFETDQDTCNVQVHYDTQNPRTCKNAGEDNYLPNINIYIYIHAHIHVYIYIYMHMFL